MSQSRSDRGSSIAQIIVHPSGYAFARRLDGDGSIFIPPHRLGGAIDGDEVDVAYWPAERGDEGRVVAVRARLRRALIGKVVRHGNRRFVLETSDPRIIQTVRLDPNLGDSHQGQCVRATITAFPEGAVDYIAARVDSVLADEDDLGTHIERVLVENGIGETFSEAVVAQARSVPNAVTEDDLEGRLDLRDRPFMTIDPVDARDFDDAVFVEACGDNLELDPMRLWVAVADVAHYVRPGTAIDEEARMRCFSSYLPHRAIPMLPEELSSGICSLVPNEDRLAMVVEMKIDAAGEIIDAQVHAAVIHSHARLTYEEAAGMMPKRGRGTAESGDGEGDDEVRSRVELLSRVSRRLRSARMLRGAVELALPETKIVLDADDPHLVRDVIQTRANRDVARAYNLIEELMVAANESVGSIAGRLSLPVVYRGHAVPDEERIEKYCKAASALGVEVDPERLVTPRGVQKALNKVKGHERAPALRMLMLRTMAQADYRAEPQGHFALASPAYVHFTSPIRRYADVISHRVMKFHLVTRRRMADPTGEHGRRLAFDDIKAQAIRCSTRERAVVTAERQTKSLFAAWFMRDRVGDEFDGSISGVTASGMFVMIDAPSVDGFVPLETLDKSDRHAQGYQLDERGVALVAARSGHALTVGDRVRVRVTAVELERRRISLELA